jgi:hypothetical protein
MFSVLHEYALAAARTFKTAESELVVLIQKIDDCQGFRELGYPSLFSYVHQELGLSEACTQQLITVSRKSKTVPALQDALALGEITISKAKAVVAVLTPENSAEWLETARTSSTRELEKAVAEARPEVPKPEKVRPQGNGLNRLDLSVDEETLGALKRAQELLAQKLGKNISLAEALKFLSTEFVRKEDPVAKADRNVARILHMKGSTQAKHRVHHRDRGTCQFVLRSGEKCGAKQWIDLHHIIPKSGGGPDTPENIVTLCTAHHRQMQVH